MPPKKKKQKKTKAPHSPRIWKLAFEKILAKAKRGNPESQMDVAYWYESGTGGVEQSFEKAVEWYRKAAEQGDAEAQYELAGFYQDGKGVEQDPKKAIEWFRLAAEQGHTDAQWSLGCRYVEGDVLEQDYKQAVYWFRKSAEQGNANSQYFLGICYQNGEGVEQDWKKAFDWFRKAAEQGDRSAQFNLACCYRDGKGVEKDKKKATVWWRKSAKQGHEMAQFFLGCCYENGQGVKRDLKKMADWIRQSAENGYEIAQYRLGDFYRNGKGVEKDIQEAAKWYFKAAEKYPGAQLFLTCLDDPKQDTKTSFTWYNEAAKNNNKEAQCCLAWCYERGEGVQRDFQTAAQWYYKSAQQGCKEALGWCHLIGVGEFKQDFPRALELYHEVAEHPWSTYGSWMLGQCYEKGFEDLKMALYWYDRSAQAGFKQALDSVKRISAALELEPESPKHGEKISAIPELEPESPKHGEKVDKKLGIKDSKAEIQTREVKVKRQKKRKSVSDDNEPLTHEKHPSETRSAQATHSCLRSSPTLDLKPKVLIIENEQKVRRKLYIWPGDKFRKILTEFKKNENDFYVTDEAEVTYGLDELIDTYGLGDQAVCYLRRRIDF